MAACGDPRERLCDPGPIGPGGKGREHAVACLADSGPQELSGNLFKIERLAVHDGPGIRTVLFFKGCPLRCRWCSSPESRSGTPEIAYSAERCIACGECTRACPEGAVILASDGHLRMDRGRCLSCGACVQACDYGARKLVGYALNLSDVMREIEKDEIFYHRSGGGVTLSGGEPALQPAFAGAILAEARRRGIATAMETCGYFAWDTCRDLGHLLDLVYVDIKHMNRTRHEKLTGVGNETILENIQRMDTLWTETDLVIRVPVIPGLNDERANMEATADFVRTLRRAARVELLPYHRYGVATYARIGKTYGLAGLRPPSGVLLEAAAAIFSSQGIPAQIGG